MIIRNRRTLERDTDDLGKARRERGGKHRVAFDDAGIAVGRALPGPATVDQRNRQSAFGEVDRDGCADDAGTEHDDVGARQGEPPLQLNFVALWYAHVLGGPQGRTQIIADKKSGWVAPRIAPLASQCEARRQFIC